MARFYIKPLPVTEGQKHSNVLFATDKEATVEAWLSMGEFFVYDSTTGKVLYDPADLQLVLAAAPIVPKVQAGLGTDYDFDGDFGID